MRTCKYQNLSANETLNAMSKLWATNKDIQKIGNVGRNKAADIRREIEEQIKSEGYNLPKQAIVPMKYVIEYFKIDINYLKKLASLERS